MKKTSNYLSIGKVAKEKKVTIKALRYYDEIGVFKPAYVDKVTNYRYYTKDQLYVLDAISLCVELGIPLKEFEKYRQQDGEFDLQKLLYDGKSMGETKIKDIRDRLGRLGETIRMVEARKNSVAVDEASAEATANQSDAKNQNAVTNESGETGQKSSMTYVDKELPARGLLTMKIEENESDDSKKILRLNMVAQLLGMRASYPAGMLFEYDDKGQLSKYVYILVEGYEECEDKRFRLLEGGTYTTFITSKIEKNEEIVTKTSEKVSEYKNLLIIQSDVIDSKDVEIQILK